jgi:prefoldin subunit 5
MKKSGRQNPIVAVGLENYVDGRDDTARAAISDDVKDLRREAQALKEAVADLTLENRQLKKV